jgi:hypothetical protein
LVAASFLSFFLWLAPSASALVGGLVELALSFVIFRGAKAFAAPA